MSFGSWLQEQSVRKDSVGDFARLTYDDYNNGCASQYYPGAVEWRDHFGLRHPEQEMEIFPLLADAFRDYVDYLQRIEKNKLS